MLLERLDASRSLADVPLAEAAATAGALARTLAFEASGCFPSVRAEARQLTTTFPARQRSLHDPVPSRWISLAVRLAADLADDPARLLVHTDLHYGNILVSKRPGQPWAAIDPRAAVRGPRAARQRRPVRRSLAPAMRSVRPPHPWPGQLARPA
ncbi:MAG: aminoglycoside phosphotransferase family protein [Streptosporangiaceae bacterium]